MIGNLLLFIMIMLILSSSLAFLSLESPVKAIAQIDRTTARGQPQLPSDRHQTGLVLVKTSRIIEGGNTSTILKPLSSLIETRINTSSSLLELTSKLPEVTNVSYANAITEKFMGIPQNLDLQKRDIARHILEQDGDIVSIFFVTPKGDVYMGEPYSDQQTTSKTQLR